MKEITYSNHLRIYLYYNGCI